jgi:hypothetical protein
MYHAITAISISRYILNSCGQDIWDGIYPKNEQGQPMYNPSGMYSVRLFILGQWKNVTIDDRLPCIADVCVLPRATSKGELWPLLVVKALMKAMTMSETNEDGETKQVLVDLPPKERFCFMVTCLTGWHPDICDVEQCDAWDTLRERVLRGNVFPVIWGNHPQVRCVCVCVCVYVCVYICTHSYKCDAWMRCVSVC